MFSTFLDISDRTFELLEEGLLGLAFHPEYESNGRFFVYYTAGEPLRNVLASYRVSAGDPNAADPASGEVLLEIEQPNVGHNGGQIRFGPDGYLYVAVGDGGGWGEDMGTGEDRRSLLGSILRIDVDRDAEGRKYAIPPDNPFAGNDDGFKEEIFAYGLRNPWRFSFDLATGDSEEIRLWVGDVGDGSYEEVNVVEKGKNYGWSTMEGRRCHPHYPICDDMGRTPPVLEYSHYEGNGAIIGGHIYRGDKAPSLEGKYIYADFVSGRIWSLRPGTDELKPNLEIGKVDTVRITSFGEDEHGESYFLGVDQSGGGHVFRFTSTPVSRSADHDVPRELSLRGSFPNPFRSSTVISYALDRTSMVSLSVFDTMGRQIRSLVQGLEMSGVHKVEWDGRDHTGAIVPSGTYFYRLSVAGGMAASGQAVVIR